MVAPAPLVGYNTNVRHKGKLFHIQTEDSGVSRPHVITHLFADGGRIVATRKTTYGEHLGAADLNDIVRRIMKEQHKAMFIALRDGLYDSQEMPAPAERPARLAASPPSGVIEGFDPSAAGDAAALADGTPTPVDPSVIPPPPEPEPPPPPRPAVARPASARPVAAPPARAPSTRPSAPSAPVRSAPAPAIARPPQPQRAPSAQPRPAAPSSPARPPSRPAPHARPGTPASKSIFGQDLISEKSLDEVILSYLSRDLEDGK